MIIAHVTVDRVVACASENEVVSSAARQYIGSYVALDRVVELIAGDGNAGGQAGLDDLHFGASVEREAVGKHVDQIIAFASEFDDMIAAASTARHRHVADIERVIAVSPVHGVGAGSPFEHIVAGIAIERIVTLIPDDPIVTGATGSNIVAAFTDDGVVSRATGQVIVADPALEDIVAGIAVERVVAVGPKDLVVATAAENRVVAERAVERLTGVGPEHRSGRHDRVAANGQVLDAQIL